MPELLGQRFVRPADVKTQVFDWGTIKWLSEPRAKATYGITILESQPWKPSRQK
jgi:hypothetical protein